MCSTVECSVWFARNGYSVRKVGEQMDLMALFAEELDDWVSLAKKFTIQKWKNLNAIEKICEHVRMSMLTRFVLGTNVCLRITKYDSIFKYV